MDSFFPTVGVARDGNVALVTSQPSVFLSPDQARALGLLLLQRAGESDGFPGSGETGEFFIDFNTEIHPGALQAVRVRIDLVTIYDMERKFDIALAEHPLYQELAKYVKANKRGK